MFTSVAGKGPTRNWAWVGAAALLLAACGSSGTDGTDPRTGAGPVPLANRTGPPNDAIVGVWRNDSRPSVGWPTGQFSWSTALLELSPDGRYALDAGGNLDTAPDSQGRYELDRAVIILTSGTGHGDCPSGDTWAMRTELRAEGTLRTVVTDDRAEPCGVGVGTQWTWTRVSPYSAAGAAITAAPFAVQAGLPPSLATLRGIWLREGTGELVRFGGDGSFASDDAGTLAANPAEFGRFTLAQSTITFAGSACTRMIWSNVSVFVDTMHADVDPADCRADPAARTTWTRLSS